MTENSSSSKVRFSENLTEYDDNLYNIYDYDSSTSPKESSFKKTSSLSNTSSHSTNLSSIQQKPILSPTNLTKPPKKLFSENQYNEKDKVNEEVVKSNEKLDNNKETTEKNKINEDIKESQNTFEMNKTNIENYLYQSNNLKWDEPIPLDQSKLERLSLEKASSASSSFNYSPSKNEILKENSQDQNNKSQYSNDDIRNHPIWSTLNEYQQRIFSLFQSLKKLETGIPFIISKGLTGSSPAQDDFSSSSSINYYLYLNCPLTFHNNMLIINNWSILLSEKKYSNCYEAYSQFILQNNRKKRIINLHGSSKNIIELRLQEISEVLLEEDLQLNLLRIYLNDIVYLFEPVVDFNLSTEDNLKIINSVENSSSTSTPSTYGINFSNYLYYLSSTWADLILTLLEIIVLEKNDSISTYYQSYLKIIEDITSNSTPGITLENRKLNNSNFFRKISNFFKNDENEEGFKRQFSGEHSPTQVLSDSETNLSPSNSKYKSYLTDSEVSYSNHNNNYNNNNNNNNILKKWTANMFNRSQGQVIENNDNLNENKIFNFFKNRKKSKNFKNDDTDTSFEGYSNDEQDYRNRYNYYDEDIKQYEEKEEINKEKDENNNTKEQSVELNTQYFRKPCEDLGQYTLLDDIYNNYYQQQSESSNHYLKYALDLPQDIIEQIREINYQKISNEEGSNEKDKELPNDNSISKVSPYHLNLIKEKVFNLYLKSISLNNESNLKNDETFLKQEEMNKEISLISSIIKQENLPNIILPTPPSTPNPSSPYVSIPNSPIKSPISPHGTSFNSNSPKKLFASRNFISSPPKNEIKLELKESESDNILLPTKSLESDSEILPPNYPSRKMEKTSQFQNKISINNSYQNSYRKVNVVPLPVIFHNRNITLELISRQDLVNWLRDGSPRQLSRAGASLLRISNEFNMRDKELTFSYIISELLENDYYLKLSLINYNKNFNEFLFIPLLSLSNVDLDSNKSGRFKLYIDISYENEPLLHALESTENSFASSSNIPFNNTINSSSILNYIKCYGPLGPEASGIFANFVNIQIKSYKNSSNNSSPSKNDSPQSKNQNFSLIMQSNGVNYVELKKWFEKINEYY